MTDAEFNEAHTAKVHQLGAIWQAVIDETFDIVLCADRAGAEFWGVMVEGKCLAVLPEPLAPDRPVGAQLQ